MDAPEYITALAEDIKEIIDAYRVTHGLTLASVVGVLEVVKVEMMQEAG